MIILENVQKKYGTKEALKNLTLTIPEGKIFGFLGHNGAGKSTTIKSLVSIITPTSGEIMVDGKSLKEHRLEIKKRIGYVPDTPNIFLQLTAMEYWNLVAAAFDLTEEEKNQQINKLASLFEIRQQVNNEIDSFSHGMRQKVIVIGALLSNPDIWILDEPMQGLDPQAAFDLKQLMREHADKGKTVIFSTHNLDTAEQLCDELAILKKGELIYNGSVSDLLKEHPDTSLETIYLEMAGRKQDERELITHDTL
ncbi:MULTISPECIES: ABC transporter ATP-binding protein [Vagococcus]|uniref:ABC transporter, ATP-binding protein n=1 Tax=Vagococcus fluvialis bH819 TaxID=1255619 RepID=A0A1X6WK62_9ENTE|nr:MULTISPECIES: ABC transporter ATP-binding protein [Vagococcus]SLM84704.1 ABC transporter, ATP-binding protein [Vagococcus fluvialis bH819]HCM89833.1 ABC transporter ATP-binding protein [Vagococcus sp.]